MPNSFMAVCENFELQSTYCKQIGSPFYADLLSTLSGLFDRNSAIGDVFSNWPGTPQHDAVALRFVAALNYLVITHADADLQKMFPPQLAIESKARTQALLVAINRHQDFIIEYLESPPQTNEVGRSTVLLGGFLNIAQCFGPELDIFEIGASAGLNMTFDQYFYRAGSWQWGDPKSSVSFSPKWTGNAPPLGPLNIQSRNGCDIAPINIATQKDRLLSYVWPDQTERIQRIRAAIEHVIQVQPNIQKTEASQWLLEQAESIAIRPRVFYHSIIWQYFTDTQRADFKANIEVLANDADTTSPLVWMRLEPSACKQHAELKTTVWPGKTEQTLARSGFHGEWVHWLGE
jgi:hypothetical protein